MYPCYAPRAPKQPKVGHFRIEIPDGGSIPGDRRIFFGEASQAMVL